MKNAKRKDIKTCILEKDANAFIKGDFDSVSSIVKDSRLATAGSLFVCLRGVFKDGHDFALDAYKRGCRHFLCERQIELPEDASVAKVKSVRAILCDLLFCFYGVQKENFIFIGVTGTKGKTTTSFLLTHLLNKAGYPCAFSGTLGLFYGTEMKPTDNTTPDLFVLAPWLSYLQSRQVRFVVIETSSAALCGARLVGLNFSLGILTSFSKDHIGKGEHSDMTEYLCAKRSLFSSYGVKTAILPPDVYCGEFIVSDAEQIMVLPPEEKILRAVEEREDGQRFFYRDKLAFLPLIGVHNRTNARLALRGASILTGKNEEEFLPYLADVFVPGRYEQITHREVKVVIDYAHNYESFLAVAKTAAQHTSGRMVCVFGSVGGRGEGRRPELAKAAEACMDFSVITEDDPCEESGLHICAQIYAAFQDKTCARIVTDRKDAIRYAFSLCKAGDTLLLLGKGHERVQKIKGKSIPFCEKEIVLSL